jgi:hypothetical protein
MARRDNRRQNRDRRIGTFLHDNALALTMMSLFVASLFGQVLSGLAAYNQETCPPGAQPLGLGAYLLSGHFMEALFENWESEFLQMGVFVVLTKFLKQKGSSESKKFDEEEEVDEDPRRHANDAEAPWPVRKGGVVLRVYEHSLSLALVGLFLASFALHAVGGARAENDEAARRGEPGTTVVAYVGTSKFWFQSFQNWQSEFFSVGALIVLSIFLRERGSPQSKPVARPHSNTED